MQWVFQKYLIVWIPTEEILFFLTLFILIEKKMIFIKCDWNTHFCDIRFPTSSCKICIPETISPSTKGKIVLPHCKSKVLLLQYCYQYITNVLRVGQNMYDRSSQSSVEAISLSLNCIHRKYRSNTVHIRKSLRISQTQDSNSKLEKLDDHFIANLLLKFGLQLLD